MKHYFLLYLIDYMLTHGLYEPHRAYVSGPTFILHQESPNKSQQFFFTFSHGGETHFLGLDLDLFGILCHLFSMSYGKVVLTVVAFFVSQYVMSICSGPVVPV